MKSFFEEYSRLIGLVWLTFVVILLFSSPSMIFAKSITTIDTELSHASGDETPVRARMDFGNVEHMDTFPMTIGDWSGSEFAASERYKESLGADMLFMRAYSRPGIPHHVFFTIIQSNNRSSFHPPIVCYPALGYTVKEETADRVLISNTSWVEPPLFGTWKKRENRSISVKKLEVTKEAADGSVKERRAVLYFYVKDNPLTSDTVTMVEVSSVIPTDGSDDGMLDVSKEFMADTIPYMFELRPEGDIIIVSLVKLGIVGWLAIAVLLGLPLLVILYPKLKKL
jgi:hypothetical protein